MHSKNIFNRGQGRSSPASVISLLRLLCVTLSLSATGYSQVSYSVITVTNGGSVSGKVHLKEATKIERMEITQDKKQCGTAKRSPRLVVDKNLGVSNAIVYLEGVKAGKSIPRQSSYVFAQKNCEFVPHVSFIPLGERLEIVNLDPILHNVHAYDSEPEPRTIFNLAQPVRNLRTKTRPMTNPGLTTIQCDAGHAWMSAILMVIDHPYFAITSADGSFRLDDVLPGTYQLRMWHEGVAILNRQLEHGKVKRYDFEPAYTDSLTIVIQPHENLHADFELVLK